MAVFRRRHATRQDTVREIVRQVRGGEQNNFCPDPTPAQVVRYARFRGLYVTEAEARRALAAR